MEVLVAVEWFLWVDGGFWGERRRGRRGERVDKRIQKGFGYCRFVGGGV